MNREQVLEDILRGRAADVVVDPGALEAILNAPNPSVINERQKRQQPQAQQPQSTPASPSPGSSSAVIGSTGGSLLGKLGGLLAATVLVVAVAAGAGYAYLESNPQCAGLDNALQVVNDEVDEKVGENPNIALACGGTVTSLAEIRDNLTPANQVEFDNNEAAISDAHACLEQAAEPLSLSSLFDALATDSC